MQKPRNKAKQWRRKIAKEKKLAVVAGTQRRHQPSYMETIKRIQDGAIGELVSGHCYWNGERIWFREKTEWVAEFSDFECPYCRKWVLETWPQIVKAYPGKVRLCNLFEPLDVDRPAGFHELNDGRHMYVNGVADSEVYRIKFATVADYEWNTSAYDPEYSLWKALVRTFGAPAGAEALQFNDAYYGLYGIGMWMEREGVTGEHLRRGDAFLDRLQGSLESLQRQLPPDHALLGELQALYDRAKTRFERLARKNPTER